MFVCASTYIKSACTNEQNAATKMVNDTALLRFATRRVVKAHTTCRVGQRSVSCGATRHVTLVNITRNLSQLRVLTQTFQVHPHLGTTKKATQETNFIGLPYHPCCGSPTRTNDLQVMSLASYQLLHPAMLFSGAKVRQKVGKQKS